MTRCLFPDADVVAAPGLHPPTSHLSHGELHRGARLPGQSSNKFSTLTNLISLILRNLLIFRIYTYSCIHSAVEWILSRLRDYINVIFIIILTVGTTNNYYHCGNLLRNIIQPSAASCQQSSLSNLHFPHNCLNPSHKVLS